MIRTLYRLLLWLHPSAFQEQFAEEMLWIFDETGASEGCSKLLFDGLLSLGRQWLLRSNLWKFAIGGLVDATLVTLHVFLRHPKP